jgi:D-glycero-alpha-D-manno-heptose 1-phosphate guanylyltransferase
LQAIILAGGLGTRLRPAVSGVPKSMAPIQGVPFIEILARRLAEQGIGKIILATGYLADQIVTHFSAFRHPGVELRFHREEELLGTGGAVFAALELCDDSEVFVLNGDTYVDVDLVALRKARLDRGASLAMCLVNASDARRYGAVTTSADGWVQSFGEKSGSGPGWINAGTYAFERRLFDRPPADSPFSFEREVIAPLVQSRKVLGFPTVGRFIDIGVPDDYSVAQELLSDVVARLKATDRI